VTPRRIPKLTHHGATPDWGGVCDRRLPCYSASDRGAVHCDERVCLSVSLCSCVCQSANISSELHVRSSSNLLCPLPMAVARSSLLWRRSDTLCTSGFEDDVIFAHKCKVDRRRRPAEAQCTRSLGLGYKLCAVIPANGRTGLLFGRLK